MDLSTNDGGSLTVEVSKDSRRNKLGLMMISSFVSALAELVEVGVFVVVVVVVTNSNVVSNEVEIVGIGAVPTNLSFETATVAGVVLTVVVTEMALSVGDAGVAAGEFAAVVVVVGVVVHNGALEGAEVVSVHIGADTTVVVVASAVGGVLLAAVVVVVVVVGSAVGGGAVEVFV